MQEILHNFTQSTELHLLAAFLLGLMVALNPCQIAICLSAMASMAHRKDNDGFTRRAYIFALGRCTLYYILGSVLCLLCKHLSLDLRGLYSQKLAQTVEMAAPFVLLCVGVFFMFRAFHRHKHNDTCHNSGNIIKHHRQAGAFVMGLVLAMLFCPESALFFFGMMIPLSVSSPFGILVVAVFAIAAVVPVAAFALFCGFSAQRIDRLQDKLEKIQLVVNLLSGIIMIGLALVFLCE